MHAFLVLGNSASFDAQASPNGFRSVGNADRPNRGQITPPAATRKRFGIKGGDVVIMEHGGKEVVPKLGVVLEAEFYSDQQIAQWDAADRLADEERKRIAAAITGPR